MTDDRLRHDRDEVKNLDDIIEAHTEGTSHMARDIDAADKDFDIPEDIDVDEALTFPHPKRKKDNEVELMGEPDEAEIDIGWAESQSEMLPSDYMDDYDDALTTNLEDEDEVAEEQIDEISTVSTEDLIYEVPIVTTMPEGFGAEEAPGEETATPKDEEARYPGELESTTQTGTNEEDITIAD